MSTIANSTKYTNFFKRFVASLIDGIILIIWNFIAFGRQPNKIDNPQAIVYYILIIICGWLYFAIMESSSLQSTLGKQLLGITVTDSHGNEISFGRATARYFGKVVWLLIFLIALAIASIGQSTGGSNSPYLAVAGLLYIISFLTLLIGYIMALFTPEKQALHDIIARCLVVNNTKQSATIPWKPLIIVAVLAVFIGKGILPQIPGSDTTSPISTEAPSPSPTTSTESTESTESTPLETRNIPSQILSLLQKLTLDDIQITDVLTPLTHKICQTNIQLFKPNSDEMLKDDYRLDWTFASIVHVGRLKMQGNSGKMRYITRYNDSYIIVDQTMQLYTSTRGLVLLGFNPIDVTTQKPFKDFRPDNLIIKTDITGTKTITTCDNGGNYVPIDYQDFENTP